MAERMRKFMNNRTIRQKLLLISFVIALLPVAIFGITITKVYQNSVSKQTRQSVDDTGVVIADRISRILKDAENCSNYLAININKVINENTTGAMSLSTQKSVTNELYTAKIIFDEIDSLAFFDEEGLVLVSDNSILRGRENILTSTQTKMLRQTSGKSVWFPREVRDFLIRDSSEPVLTIGKKVIQINTGETLGYIIANIDISSIEKILANQLINYCLEDENGINISTVVTSKYLEPKDIYNIRENARKNQVYQYAKKRYYVSGIMIEGYNWRLTGITDMNEYNVQAKNILYIAAAIAIATILLEIILSHFLTRMITVPLGQLKAGAEEIASGNMKQRLHFKTGDEVGQLGATFNHMARQVEELLVKVDYEAKKKQEYELALVHEQIKPHFLYNCLDVIAILTEMNRNKEAGRAVKKLANYYRRSLSDSKQIITIAQEVQIVEDYLELQRIRYNDLFTYEIQIDRDIMSMLIPKLTLQPLVENAIYHGLKYRNEAGFLKITGEKTESGMILRVADNGIGMDEHKRREILKHQPEGHFGVYSVSHRIKLFFGEEYGLHVDSVAGEKTIVEVILPAVEKMGEETDD